LMLFRVIGERMIVANRERLLTAVPPETGGDKMIVNLSVRDK